MSTWDWPGARWWKCDLHVHTNGSDDVADGDPDDVVASALAQYVNVIGVTDHNTGAMVDDMRAATARAGAQLTPLPGTELSINGIHLLILFDPDKARDDVVAFLGACGIAGAQQGSPDAHANVTVLEAMRLAAEHQGVVIAAHIDGPKGLLKVIPNGQDLIDIVRSERLLAGEVKVRDQALLCFVDDTKGDYHRRFGALTLVESSDAHRHADVGTSYTWIKMSAPSTEGLRLALLDGSLSVIRASEAAADPNRHARLAIESVTIRKSKLVGRGGDFVLSLNPWFCAIIGGRGTGKSTVLELLRLALHREGELPPSLRPEFDRLAKIPENRDDTGLLLADTCVEVVYRKDDDRYLVRWQDDKREILREADDGSWEHSEGDVSQRFPVQIFSQKQMFEIARNPEALLDMVDDAIEDEYIDFKFPLVAAERAFISARRETATLHEGIAVEGNLRGELEDVNRRIAVYEGAEHATVRKEYRARIQQQSALDDFAEGLDALAAYMGTVAASISIPQIDHALFDDQDPIDSDLVAAADTVRERCSSLVKSIESLRDDASRLRVEFDSTIAGISDYSARLKAARAAHEELKQRLETEANAGLDDYDALVARRAELVEELRAIEVLKPRLAVSDVTLHQAAQDVATARRAETSQRVTFIERTVGKSEHVRIEVIPYGSRLSAETRLRAAIGRQEGGFGRDIESILGDLYHGYGDSVPTAAGIEVFEQRLTQARQRLIDMVNGNQVAHPVQDARFAAHLCSLTSDAVCQIETWTPDDSLRVSYSPNGDGTDFTPLEHGSPGQKTAALLAFILSYGESPIILDQPEDDLENRLIYDLVVRRVREVKGGRQVVAVTHDANIVVNGDAELVTVFEFQGGRTQVSQQGGLQEQSVRESICEVLEGGRLAFEERYRRIGEGEG